MITAIECACMHSRLSKEEIKQKYSWVLSALNEFASRAVLAESTPPPADVDIEQLAADAWFEFEYPDGSLYEGVFKGGFLVGYKAAADKR